MASSITDKKVPTEADATFQKMAENILKISGGISYHGIYARKKVKEYVLLEG